jgi:hypothetical protein
MVYVWQIIDGAYERVGYIDPETGHIIKFNNQED